MQCGPEPPFNSFGDLPASVHLSLIISSIFHKKQLVVTVMSTLKNINRIKPEQSASCQFRNADPHGICFEPCGLMAGP